MRRGFTLVEVAVAALVALVFASVAVSGYTSRVDAARQDAVKTAAATVNRQLCADSVFRQKRLDDYQVADFATVAPDVAHTGTAVVVVVNPLRGPQVALKGTAVATVAEGTGVVVGEAGYEVRFSLAANGCVLTPVADAAPTPTPSPTPTPTVSEAPPPVLLAAPVWDPAGPAGTGTPGAFDRAVFTMGNFTATNSFRLLARPGGAPLALYVNGDFACNSGAYLDGYVHATGSVSLTNNCRVGGVWAHGTITTSTKGVGIWGNATSATGSLAIGNNPLFLDGEVRVAGRVINSDGGTPTISGAISEHQAALPTPPAMTLPVYRHDGRYWTGWATADWTSFARSIAQANKAPKWVLSGSLCSVSNANWSINGAMTGPASATVLDARGCKTLEFNGSAGANTLTLRADLTIIVNDFTNSGLLHVASADGEPKVLRIISPYTSASDACGRKAAGAVTFQAGGVSVDTAVSLFLYSGNTVTLTNGMDFNGQVYGCTVTASNDTTIRFAPVGIPAW